MRRHFLTRWTCLLLALWVRPMPGSAEISLTDGLTQEHSVEAGKTYNSALHLKNLGSELAQAKIYQTDYLFYSDGRNIYGKPGQDPRSNAKWVGLSDDFIAIPPKGTATLDYTIHVPTGAVLQGTYWSLVMIEESQAAPEIGKREDQKPQVGIRQVIRYGVQIVTHIGKTGKSKVGILKKELIKKDGRKVYGIDIENSGDRWIVPEISMELFDAHGARAGMLRGRKMRIFPGTSIHQELDVSGVAPGRYKGLIVIDGGDDGVFGARTELAL